MSDKAPEGGRAPGATAADDAPTQQVPRLPKPGTDGAKPSGSTRTDVTPVSRPRTEASGAGRPDETAVIPVVRDEPRPAKDKAQPPAAPAKPVAKGAAKPAESAKPAAAAAPAAKASPGAASAGAASPAASTSQATASGGTRQARLRLSRVEPWSVTKVAFTLSVALMIVAVVAMTVLWTVLSIAGVWDQINSTISSVLSDDTGNFDIKDYLGFGRLVGLTLVLSAINVLITTAVAAVAAHLYNLAAQLLGGVEVTFAEDR